MDNQEIFRLAVKQLIKEKNYKKVEEIHLLDLFKLANVYCERNNFYIKVVDEETKKTKLVPQSRELLIALKHEYIRIERSTEEAMEIYRRYCTNIMRPMVDMIEKILDENDEAKK